MDKRKRAFNLLSTKILVKIWSEENGLRISEKLRVRQIEKILNRRVAKEKRKYLIK